LAISAYALKLMGLDEEADKYINKLLSVANRDEKMLWWSNQYDPLPIKIETTSYVLMALLKNPSKDNLLLAGDIVRWLNTQRNSQGGFITSQDTSVALDALSRYSNIIKAEEPNLRVQIKTDLKKRLNDTIVRSTDESKVKVLNLQENITQVILEAVGKGCILTQLSIQYNKNEITAFLNDAPSGLMLETEAKSVSTTDKCSIINLSVCVSYSSAKSLKINMAIAEVDILSGYEPDRASLYALIDSNSTKIKKFEETDNKVVLYYTEVNNEIICTSIYLNRYAKIEGDGKSYVKLYDYYNPALNVTSMYQMESCFKL